MYADFYGFREMPFNVTPDPRFLYLNNCYQEALAALGYGIDARKGFISLVGEAGTGKTTLLRRLLDTLGPTTRTVLLLNPTVDFEDILEHILLELGVPSEGGRKLVLLQRLNEFLIEHTAGGGNVALLIDEAQDLRPKVLEELRLLSNLETAREKILQIVLAGQPELETILADPSLRQLRQRVALRIRLSPLSPAEVGLYVRSRLERAGATTPELFTTGALARIAEFSQGIPRLVNVLCDGALLAGFSTESPHITAALVEEVWRDLAEEIGVAPKPVMPQPAVCVAAVSRVAPPPLEAPVAIPPASAPPSPAYSAPAPAPAAAPEPAPVAAAEPLPVAASDALPAAAPEPPPVAALEALPIAAPEPVRASGREPARAAAPNGAPVAPPDSAMPPLPRHPARPVPSSRSPLGIPVAAALVALLAVGLSLVSLHQDGAGPDTDDDTTAIAAATPAIGGPGSATAAEPPAGEMAGAPGDAPLSSTEAAALVDDFRAAYEARDVERLLGLFASDASENGRHGLEAIAAAYRTSLPAFTEVRYSMPRFSVEPRGARADVRAPFVITYQKAGGARGEVRGQAEWQLERRQGQPRIVALNYRLDSGN